jgi:hypothetical protein
VGLYLVLTPYTFGTTLIVLPASLVAAASTAFVAGYARCVHANRHDKQTPSGGPGIAALGEGLGEFFLAAAPIFPVTFGFVHYSLTKMLQ